VLLCFVVYDYVYEFAQRDRVAAKLARELSVPP
jgi:hypothetical protein